jgi:hypothetical protein
MSHTLVPPASRLFEADMFVTMRRYSPKNGAINKASLDLLRRQIKDLFLPIVQAVPGFRAYYVLNVNNQEVMMLNFCDTEQAAGECSRCLADYAMRNPLVYELGPPEVTEAQVLAGCEIAAHTGPEAEDGAAVAAAIALWLEESRGMLLSLSEQ